MRFGDVVQVDFGTPVGSEAGFQRPGVIVVADPFLGFRPTTVFVVPLTTTRRSFPSHVEIEPDERNGLEAPSWALVEQLRAVATERCGDTQGNLGPVASEQIRQIIAMIVGLSA